jgi:hypothetical protein
LPLETIPGRNQLFKRYGALFTCLVTRAVHLKMAESLSTDDRILVFRHFISLYRKPTSVHSDKGANLVGVENELNSLIQEMPKDPSF